MRGGAAQRFLPVLQSRESSETDTSAPAAPEAAAGAGGDTAAGAVGARPITATPISRRTSIRLQLRDEFIINLHKIISGVKRWAGRGGDRGGPSPLTGRRGGRVAGLRQTLVAQFYGHFEQVVEGERAVALAAHGAREERVVGDHVTVHHLSRHTVTDHLRVVAGAGWG